MTTHDDLDRRIADQLHAEAPGRAPEFLMEGAMNRIADTPQRPRRFLGSTGGRLLAAAAVLLLAVVAGTQLGGLLDRQSATGNSPSASPSASASAAPSATPAPTVSPSAVPSDTPSPSPTGGSGELPTGPAAAVMSFSAACDVSGPVNVPVTTVVEDGRVIWQDDEGHLQVRQLTPESLEDFRVQIRSTGLFETSARYELERRAGTPEPPGHGLCVWSFTWNNGGDDVEVISVGWQGDEEEATYYEPAPERRTLDDLATQLRDPTTWYGEDGWVQPDAVIYEPEQYLVIATVWGPPQMATEGAPDFDDVTWPFEQPPDDFGSAYDTINDPPSRCGIASAESIGTLAGELAAATLEQFELPAPIGAGAALPWEARDGAVDMSLWPVLPDGRPPCGPED